jgi:hypothetical protein
MKDVPMFGISTISKASFMFLGSRMSLLLVHIYDPLWRYSGSSHFAVYRSPKTISHA